MFDFLVQQYGGLYACNQNIQKLLISAVSSSYSYIRRYVYACAAAVTS